MTQKTHAQPAAPQSGSALETYLETVDPAARPVVLALDAAIRGAYPDFDTAIKYRILMYAMNGDFHTWVCSVNAEKRRVALHFLYGFLLDDSRHVLRGGSSVLMTWDFPFDADVDPVAVGAYVSEAVAKNADYKSRREEVLEASRVVAKAAGRRR